MDRNKFNVAILGFKHRTPFRPFTAVTVGGGRYEVDHPDGLAVRDGMTIFVGTGSIPEFFDHDVVSEVVGGLAGQDAKA